MPQKRTSKQHILILTADAGGPEARVASALQKYLRSAHGTAVDSRVTDVYDELLPSTGVLAKFAYQQSRAFYPPVTGTLDDVRGIAPEHPLAAEADEGFIRSVAEAAGERGASAVIAVGALAGAIAAGLPPRERPYVATVLPDYSPRDAWLHPDVDLYFVPSQEGRDELVVRGIAYGRVVVSGVPVDPECTAPHDRGESRRALDLADRFTVTLTPLTGGSDVVARIAGDLAGAGIQVAVHPDNDTRLTRRLEAPVRKSELVVALGEKASRQGAIAASDVMACRAGSQWLYESLAIGRPCLIYNPVPGHEVHGADFLGNMGAVWMARDAEDLVEKARFLSSHPKRMARFAEDAAGLSMPYSAQAVCERVLASI